ncbi:hypothetical protein CQW23_29724 [Capsicum baccatum]|uniref:Ubiquitin-like protease family profile domain-containing protein n=1 Tax=Capsicum baccatum TaxID=33114 RepID=A0A2G2VCL6_CAPBA|nr:hypothetical protein CQW23_29724 [Capsicum baccatum]
MSVLYYPGNANIVANDLNILSLGSVAHVENNKRELVWEVHRLASLGVRLVDSAEGNIWGQSSLESSLVSEVKEKKDKDSSLVKLKGSVKEQKDKKAQRRKMIKIRLKEDQTNEFTTMGYDHSRIKAIVAFKNIEPTQREMAKFQILEKDVLEDEHSVDSDDDFQDPPPKQINQQFAEKEPEQPNVEDVALDRSGQLFSPNVVQNLDNMFDGTKISDEKVDQTKFSDSQFIIPDEMLLSLNAYPRESITTHLSKIHEEELTDEYLNDKKSESVVEDHCQINKENVGMGSKSELHGYVDLGNEEKIMTPPDEQRDELVWPDSQNTNPGSSVGYIHKFSQKDPFFYHPINGIVDAKIVKKFVDWISVDLLKGHAKRKELNFKTIQDTKIKSSDLFDVLFEDNLPQQSSESLDCGLYVITYTECLSYGHKVLSIEFDLNTLRTRYIALLWDNGIRKQEANAHSDFEAPLRPVRQRRIASVTEVFDV